MNRGWQRWVFSIAAIGAVLLLAGILLLAPNNPVALIRVVDAAGKPVPGATIMPDALRTKPGPYVSGHYGWNSTANKVKNDPVITDADGYARVPYPKFVMERLETGEISFLVSHAEYVSDRPFRVVATAPPAGAPWRVRAIDFWNRVRHKELIARVDPVVMKKGAIVRLSLRPGSGGLKDGILYGEFSGNGNFDANFWTRPEPGVLLTRRFPPGKQTVRAVMLDDKGSAWFSDLTGLTAVSGLTNSLEVELKPGLTVHGQLDAGVPRPVANGAVVAHVWPQGLRPQDSPPQWHAWAKIGADGTFEIGSLPAGDLELVAMCDGFVSVSGPGQNTGMRYPQKHLLLTNGPPVTIDMEATARLEVMVLDDQGKPLRGAEVQTWPNVRYGEYSATLLMGDLYNAGDFLRGGPPKTAAGWWLKMPEGFRGTTDSSGLAVASNLPADVTEFSVQHPKFALPAVMTAIGQKRRQADVELTPGATNRVTVKLQRIEESPIGHY